VSNDPLSNDERSGSGYDERIEVPQETLVAIEEAIRAAGAFVRPSDDLRPRTLETARELSEDRRGGVRLASFAAVLLLCLIVSAPVGQRLSAWYQRIEAPSAAELQQQALQIETDRNTGPHWGLYEAFSQLRRSQAVRLGQRTVHGAMQ